MAARVTRYLI